MCKYVRAICDEENEELIKKAESLAIKNEDLAIKNENLTIKAENLTNEIWHSPYRPYDRRS